MASAPGSDQPMFYTPKSLIGALGVDTSAAAAQPESGYDLILNNPPFGASSADADKPSRAT